MEHKLDISQDDVCVITDVLYKVYNRSHTINFLDDKSKLMIDNVTVTKKLVLRGLKPTLVPQYHVDIVVLSKTEDDVEIVDVGDADSMMQVAALVAQAFANQKIDEALDAISTEALAKEYQEEKFSISPKFMEMSAKIWENINQSMNGTHYE